MSELKPEDTRLSYSSGTLLKNCEQKFQYYKVEKREKDKDTLTRDESHFAIGKSFHYVLETSLHEKPEKIMGLLESCVQNEGLKEEFVGLTHGMILKYLRSRIGSTLKVVGCEYEIKHPKIIGYIDAIEVCTKTGDWYISDLKTAASFYDNKIPELPSNDQLNLYCSFYKEIAKEYNLDPDKFKGARYLVACKSKAVQQKKETYADYVTRLADKHIKCIFITIPKELMRIDQARKEMESLYKKSISLRNGKSKPTKNLTYCNAFFRPCDYFSLCHGKQHSEFMISNEIIVEKY